MSSSFFSNFDILDNDSERGLWELALLPYRNSEGEYVIIRLENDLVTDEPLTFEEAKAYISGWLNGKREGKTENLN